MIRKYIYFDSRSSQQMFLQHVKKYNFKWNASFFCCKTKIKLTQFIEKFLKLVNLSIFRKIFCVTLPNIFYSKIIYILSSIPFLKAQVFLLNKLMIETHYQIFKMTSRNFRHSFVCQKLNILPKASNYKAHSLLNKSSISPQWFGKQNQKKRINQTFDERRRIHTQHVQHLDDEYNLQLNQQNCKYDSLSKRSTQLQFYKQNQARRYLRTTKTDLKILKNKIKVYQHQKHNAGTTNMHIQSFDLKKRLYSAKKRTLLVSTKKLSIQAPQKSPQKFKARSNQRNIPNVKKSNLIFFAEQKNISSNQRKLSKIRINKLIIQRKSIQQQTQDTKDLCPWEPQFQIDLDEIVNKTGNIFNSQQPLTSIKQRKKQKIKVKNFFLSQF